MLIYHKYDTVGPPDNIKNIRWPTLDEIVLIR